MQKYEITWERTDRFLPFRRKNTVTAATEQDAINAFWSAFGKNDHQIVEVKAVKES